MKDFISLFAFAELCIGIAENTSVRVLGQKSKYAFLPSTPLGDIVFLDESILPVERNGVEIEVEGMTSLQANLSHCVKPEAHELWVAGRIDPTAILSEKRTFGGAIKSGK